VGLREEGKLVKIQTEHGETFLMKTEGQDITSGYPTHPMYIPHPSLTIATNRAKLRIWVRGEKTGQEEDRMVPSNISPPSLTSGIEEPPSLREMG